MTDYLYTRWFPTLNAADCLITGGALFLAIGALRGRVEHQLDKTPTHG